MKPDVWTKLNADRRGAIGGSDARMIMGDEEAALVRLWREKRGDSHQRSSDTISQIAGALARVLVAELENPEKALTATIASPFPAKKAGLSAMHRWPAGSRSTESPPGHCDRARDRADQTHDHAPPHLRRMGGFGSAGLPASEKRPPLTGWAPP